MMSAFIKCLHCGVVHEHKEPIGCKDITEYTCSNCGCMDANILSGYSGMFTDKEYCVCGNRLKDGDDELGYLCKQCR